MLPIRFLLTAAGCLLLFAAGEQLRAAEPTAEQLQFFEKQVRPVLVAHCVECHGPDAQESELRVDSLAALAKGGTRGPALLPGNATESLLIRAIGHGETLQMPPKKKLAAKQIADLATWVKQGAIWPNEKLPDTTTPAPAAGLANFTDKQTSHWAFQPMRQPPLPAIRDGNGAASPVDHFILARLEAAGLTLAPQADKGTLLRRATFDLTGLPPTPQQLDAFLVDDAPDAWERVLDRLLASPHYGEKYGRHWLDLARYADSNGLDENLAYANAFRYRDYVIAAFNKDKPYDRFAQEQLAGDLLPHADLAAEFEGLTATGFLSLGAKMLAEDDPVKMQMDIIDEQIDTLGKCFLGLTLGCARCHDHKFDPVDMRDYYGLAGIFKSTKTMLNHNVVAQWQERPLTDKETLAKRDAIVQQVSTKRGEANSLAMKAREELLAAERARAGDYLYAAALRIGREDAFAHIAPHGDLPPEKRAEIPGLILREAEDYDRGNVIKDTTSYGPGIGVLVNRGEQPNFAEYDLEIPQAGTYQFELRYAAAGSRPSKVYVNGKLALGNAAGKVTGSWHPEGQKWFVEGLLDLPSGKVTIRLEQPTFFPHIDKLLVAPATKPAASTELVIEPPPASELKEVFVEQWRQALAASKSDPASILAFWNAPQSSAGADPELQKFAERLDLASAKSPRERADRYGRLFAEGLTAWKSLQSTEEGKKSQALEDSVLEAARKLLYDDRGPFREPKKFDDLLPDAVQKQVRELRDAAAALEKTAPQVPEAMAVSEDKPQDVRIHFRGNHLTLGQAAPRQFLRVVAGPEQPAISTDCSGRLELAQWLTRPEHPLTSRVIANRLWQWHFGKGLAPSSDNFGLLGETPTHPELLDWLAQDLIAGEWSLKRMHRRLMGSAAYQQLAILPQSQIIYPKSVDPENRLLSHFPRRRLTVEEIRDGILFVSGTLNMKMGGSYLPTKNRSYVTSTANVNPAIYDQACRSVYMPVVRSALYEVFQAFDFADPSVLIAQREATTVAPQALFMLNSQVTAGASRALAEELLAQSNLDDQGRVQMLYQRSYGRSANEGEVARSLKFVERYRAASGDNSKAWQALCRSILAANEFVYVE